MTRKAKTINKKPDVVLIGAGIMSATLGIMLKEFQPDLTIEAKVRMRGIMSATLGIMSATLGIMLKEF
eukprot:gene48485-65790_t